jgi:hypothetical protein
MPAVELGGIGISVLSTDAGKRAKRCNDTLYIEEPTAAWKSPDDMMQGVACVAGPPESQGNIRANLGPRGC